MEKVVPEGEWSYYYYRLGKDSQADVEKYREFLVEEGFELKENEEGADYLLTYKKDSAVAGKLFVLQLEYPLGGDEGTGIYGIKLSREDKPQDGSAYKAATRDEIMDYFLTLPYEKLGLSKPIREYYIVMDMGRTYIDGKDCYGINLYEKGNGSGSYFVKKFFLSLGEKRLYEYMAGDIISMQHNSSINGMDDTSGTSGTGGTNSNSGIVYDWKIGPVQ